MTRPQHKPRAQYMHKAGEHMQHCRLSIADLAKVVSHFGEHSGEWRVLADSAWFNTATQSDTVHECAGSRLSMLYHARDGD